MTWQSLEYYGSIVLIISGIYISFIGYMYHPKKDPNIQRWTLRIHYALIGYAFGILFMLQACLYDGDTSTLILLTIIIPIIVLLIITVLYKLGDILIGAYIFFLTTRFIVIATSNYIIANSLNSVQLQAMMGFLGALISYNFSVYKIESLLLLLHCVSGIGFALTGLSCFIKSLHPIRVTDFNLNLPLSGLTYCTSSAINLNQSLPFFITTYVAGILTIVLQKITGKVLTAIFFKEKSEKYEFEGKKEIKKSNEISNQKAQFFLHSLWYFVRNKGEAMSFKDHEKTLQIHLDELGLKERPLEINEPTPDSQFIAVADQLNMLYKKNITPEDIRRDVVEWLEDKENWDMLCNLEDDLFQMKNLDQKEYCEKLRNGAWGDFITLQAIVEKYETEVALVTSVSQPPLIQFPLLHKKIEKQNEEKKITFKKIAQLKDSDKFYLVGSDGNEVEIQEVVADQSPVLKQKIKEAKANGTNKISFEDKLSSRALKSIVEQLEAHYYIKTTSLSNPEISAAYHHLDLMGKFGPDVGIEESDEDVLEKKSMILSHFWGYHFGSLEIGISKPGETSLDEKESRMRTWSRPYARMLANRVVIILIIPAGLWWLTWMLLWGYNYDNFFNGLQFTLFFVAELINFTLGIVFNFNFWNPVHRKWKSINHLEPPFTEPVTVNCLISHYSEPCEDTERTVHGALRMKTTEETNLKVWICDDGFWKPIQSKQEPVKKKTFYQKFREFIRKCCNFRYQPAKDNNEQEMSEKSKDKEPEKKDSNPSIETFKGEDDILKSVAEHYKVRPSPLALKMVKMCRKQLYRYYSEKLLGRVDIDCNITLKTEEDIVRSDCARGSLKYVMFAKDPKTNTKIRGPEIVLVGRIKPSYHHYKAGNHNNILFNEQMEGEFIVFLDNDMKPKPDFLLRTLPWFYYYHEPKKRYFINKGIAFIQTPQFFKQKTLAGERDHLGGRNSVFFQGIQHGRDGYDLCAFAGTNAIFRLPALHTIGGVPYGSLTEDAHTALKLHQYGYRSVYVPDKLAVGISPVTVANSMQQRARWCKGSVQMFFLYMLPSFLCGLKTKDKPKWSKKNPFSIEKKEEIALYAVPAAEQGVRELMRKFYAIDTTSWPFSAVTAIMYMLVAFIFLISGQAPIYFGRSPLGYRMFLLTFLPYYFFKIVSQILSYEKVNPNDVWVAQEIWYSYSFASVYGIIDALKEHFTGKGLGGWGVTGEGTRTGKLEYCNFFVLVILVFSIIVRFFIWLFSSNKNQNLVDIAAIFFAGTIVIQMWPIVATTVYEWVYNSHLKPEDKVDLKRFEIPKYVIFSGTLIFVIIISQFF